VTDPDENERRALQEAIDFRTGASVAGLGLAGFLFWMFILNFILGGGLSADIYDRCLTATNGLLKSINRSTFPTQVWCEIEGNAYAGALYSFWESAGLSSVSVGFAIVMLYGGWMMVRRAAILKQT
jgi:hypothetical protein